MVDEGLNTALKVLREAWEQYREDPARKAGEKVPTGDERFLAELGPERGPELLASIRSLLAEAAQVPDPGGPMINYVRALAGWAATHPEVSPREMTYITYPLEVQHR